MPITGLLFDKDGTLFDFQGSWAQWLVAELQDLSGGQAELTQRLAARVGFDLHSERFREDSVVIAGTLEETVAAMLPDLPDWGAGDLVARLAASAARTSMAPAADLEALFAMLQSQGYALGIATNDAESAARAHLAEARILGVFDYIAGYDSGHGAKPDPGMCTAFAKAVHMPPETLLMIGDSTHDLRAGRAAGFQTLAVLTGVAGPDELAPFADAILPDIGHLPDWLPQAG